MAIIKHIKIRNSNYDAATDYLCFQHDEFTNKPILNDHGEMIPRESYLLDGINCDPFTFGRECEATNAYFKKNQTRDFPPPSFRFYLTMDTLGLGCINDFTAYQKVSLDYFC